MARAMIVPWGTLLDTPEVVSAALAVVLASIIGALVIIAMARDADLRRKRRGR